jgi:hypothetical protein
MSIGILETAKDQEKQWLTNRFPFLAADFFYMMVSLELRYRLSLENEIKQISSESELSLNAIIIVQMTNVAKAQMLELATIARGSLPDAGLARRMLCSILLSDMSVAEEIRGYCTEVAAAVIREIAHAIAVTNARSEIDRLLECARNCLLHRPWLSEKTRLDLLAAYGQLTKFRTPLSGSLIMSRRESTVVLTDCLLLELSNSQNSQNIGFIEAVLSLLCDQDNQHTLPLLEVLLTQHANDEVRAASAKAHKVLSNRLEKRWNETQIDQISSLSSRSKRLLAAFESNDANVITQTIFNNMKGSPITSVNDPRAGILNKLIQKSEIGALAVLWTLFAEGFYNEELEKFFGAMFLAADLSMNGKKASVRTEAANVISMIRVTYPKLEKQIEAVLAVANDKFVINYLKAVA